MFTLRLFDQTAEAHFSRRARRRAGIQLVFVPKLLLVCRLGGLPALAALAQSDQAASTPALILEQGVGRHTGIDTIYAAFSAGCCRDCETHDLQRMRTSCFA